MFHYTYMGKDVCKIIVFSPLYIYFRKIWRLPSDSSLKMHKYVFYICHQIISYLFSSFLNKKTIHSISVCVNNAISPNKFYAAPPLDIGTIPRTSSQADIISDVYEPSQVPSHPSIANSSPE